MSRWRSTELAWAVAMAFTAAACASDRPATTGPSGTVMVDGSSTVYPVTEAVAEEFTLEMGRAVRVMVGISGTGGGFKRFCTGETDLSNASRAISASERDLCAEHGVEFLELPIAYDGLTVAVNRENEFAACLTVEELKRIWAPGSEVRRWSDVRGSWPGEPIRLYGPGTDSGTFDYFTEAVVGEEKASRADFTASEDDNVLVQGVAGDRYSLGYFGYAYYEQNRERLRPVAVDGGEGCVAPSPETIRSGAYRPLSRPLFLYVSRAALERPEVGAFLRFYMENAEALVPEAGYVPLESASYRENLRRLEAARGAGTS